MQFSMCNIQYYLNTEDKITFYKQHIPADFNTLTDFKNKN